MNSTKEMLFTPAPQDLDATENSLVNETYFSAYSTFQITRDKGCFGSKRSLGKERFLLELTSPLNKTQMSTNSKSHQDLNSSKERVIHYNESMKDLYRAISPQS
jgi:hypothetical protein